MLNQIRNLFSKNSQQRIAISLAQQSSPSSFKGRLNAKNAIEAGEAEGNLSRVLDILAKQGFSDEEVGYGF